MGTIFHLHAYQGGGSTLASVWQRIYSGGTTCLCIGCEATNYRPKVCWNLGPVRSHLLAFQAPYSKQQSTIAGPDWWAELVDWTGVLTQISFISVGPKLFHLVFCWTCSLSLWCGFRPQNSLQWRKDEKIGYFEQKSNSALAEAQKTKILFSYHGYSWSCTWPLTSTDSGKRPALVWTG